MQLTWDDFFSLQRFGMTKGLDNIRRFCQQLGNPQNTFPAIHIAGTNGKGSVAAMLDAILRSAEVRVGLYTSPHLVSFCERICVAGEQIPENAVFSFLERHWHLIQEYRYTFFEVATAMALDFFQRQHVDVAVVEVGLGGTYDATNIVHPILSVITRIDFDHLDRLGTTLQEIASDKAGILRSEVPVVISDQRPDVKSVLLKRAVEMGAPYHEAASTTFPVLMVTPQHIQGTARSDCPDHSISIGQFTLPLTGDFQIENLKTALTCCCLLANRFPGINAESVRRGLSNVKWAGRIQLLRHSPTVILDVGHNPSAVQAALAAVRRLWQPQQLVIIFSALRDKDVIGMMKLFKKEAQTCFLVPLPPPRGLTALELQGKSAEAGLTASACGHLEETMNEAFRIVSGKGVILILGSHYLAEQVLKMKKYLDS